MPKTSPQGRQFQGLFKMDNLRKRARYFALCLSLVFVTSSCATNRPDGASFTDAPNIPAGKAVIYFYRPADESFGSNRTYDLSVNGAKTVELLYGGYFPFVASPGKIAVTADTHFTAGLLVPLVGAAAEAATRYNPATLNLSVASGNVLYVRFHPIVHATSFEPTLTVVSKDVAVGELSGAKLLSAMASQ